MMETWAGDRVVAVYCIDEIQIPILMVGHKKHISSDLFMVWHQELKTGFCRHEAKLKSQVANHFHLPAPGFVTLCGQCNSEVDIPGASLQEMLTQKNHIHADEFHTCGLHLSMIRKAIVDINPDFLSFDGAPGTWIDTDTVSSLCEVMEAIRAYA
jgi:hypothetical protein